MTPKRSIKILAVWSLLFSTLIFFQNGYAYDDAVSALMAGLLTDETSADLPLDENALIALKGVVNDQTRDWHIRIKAIKMLGRTGNPSVTDSLMFAMYDPCPAIKWNAAVGLGKFHDDPRVIDVLIDALRDDTLFVKETVIQSIGEIGNSRAAPYIIPELGSGSFAIKFSAIKALGKIGGREMIPYLKRIAETDNDMLIRNEALSVLGGIDY